MFSIGAALDWRRRKIGTDLKRRALEGILAEDGVAARDVLSEVIEHYRMARAE